MTYESRPRTRWEPEASRVPDPMCSDCGTWHLRDQHTASRLEMARVAYDRLVRDGATDFDTAWADLRAAVQAELFRELEDQVRALPKEGRRHVGSFVELAAVLALLTPRRVA